jgi:hypothetical protein
MPVPACWHTDWAPAARDTWTQAWPCASWHIESDVQKMGQSVASSHTLPPLPKSQHFWPFSV